jgi:hypothetical protein
MRKSDLVVGKTYAMYTGAKFPGLHNESARTLALARTYAVRVLNRNYDVEQKINSCSRVTRTIKGILVECIYVPTRPHPNWREITPFGPPELGKSVILDSAKKIIMPWHEFTTATYEVRAKHLDFVEKEKEAQKKIDDLIAHAKKVRVFVHEGEDKHEFVIDQLNLEKLVTRLSRKPKKKTTAHILATKAKKNG